MHKFDPIRSFLVAAVLLGAVVTGRAQVITPNPAATIIKTAPYTITKTRFLPARARTSTTVASRASPTMRSSPSRPCNVTLDFGGHYISGPSNARGHHAGRHLRG